MLTRYWIEFKSDEPSDLPYGLSYGCGVTAFDFTDAIKIIQDKIFKGNAPPEVKIKTDHIDIQTLDAGHVLPNMTSPDKRGIWFPIGFQDNY